MSSSFMVAVVFFDIVFSVPAIIITAVVADADSTRHTFASSVQQLPSNDSYVPPLQLRHPSDRGTIFEDSALITYEDCV